MREQKTKAQEKIPKLYDNNHPLHPHTHPDINQPPLSPTYPISPSFVIAMQWVRNSWYK